MQEKIIIKKIMCELNKNEINLDIQDGHFNERKKKTVEI